MTTYQSAETRADPLEELRREAPYADCDWQPDDLNPGPECPYCAGQMCARFDGLGCNHDVVERHGYSRSTRP